MLHLVFEELQESIASFIKRSPCVGKAYFYQCIELISISREVVAVQRAEIYVGREELIKLLNAVNDTFTFAKKAKSSKLAEADDAIRSFKESWGEYVANQRTPGFTVDVVLDRMTNARKKDERAMNRKSIIEGKAQGRDGVEEKGFKTKAEFWVYKKPEWNAPEIYFFKKLKTNMSLDVVLFHLVDGGLFTLDLNPHFYSTIPPASRDYAFPLGAGLNEGCSLEFSEELGKTISSKNGDRKVKLHVLLDRKTRIFFGLEKSYRVFGNIWDHEGRTYLKDIHGQLLDADHLRERLQMSEGIEVGTVSSPASGSTIRVEARCEWKDFLKKAKLAKEDLIFRPIVATNPTNHEYANPASPIPPAFPSQLSLGRGHASGLEMPLPMHMHVDQHTQYAGQSLMPMPLPQTMSDNRHPTLGTTTPVQFSRQESIVLDHEHEVAGSGVCGTGAHGPSGVSHSEDNSTKDRRYTDTNMASSTFKAPSTVADSTQVVAKGHYASEKTSSSQSSASDAKRQAPASLVAGHGQLRNNGHHSHSPGQHEGTFVSMPAPAYNQVRNVPKTAIEPLSIAQPTTGLGTGNGKAMPAATKEASSKSSQPGWEPVDTPTNRGYGLPPPVSNASAAPVPNITNTIKHSHHDLQATSGKGLSSASSVSSRDTTPTPKSVPEAKMQSRPPPHHVDPARVGDGGKANSIASTEPKNDLTQKGGPPPGPIRNTPSKTPLAPADNAKKKGWFTRVVEKVKDTVGWR